MRQILSHLTFWVLLAIIVGILLGHFAPQFALQPVFAAEWKTHFLGQELKIGKTLSEALSGVFISLVKIFINPIIFLTISIGIVQMGDLKKVGRLGAKALIYFEVVTTIALLIGIVVATIIRPGAGVSMVGVEGDISKYQKGAMEFSWLQFLQDNSTLQTLLVALIFGVLLSKYTRRNQVLAFLNQVAHKIFTILHYTMFLAPIGAFGGMAFTIAKYGVASLLSLAKLMFAVYLTMGLFIFVVLWAILRQAKIPLLAFLTYIRAELLIVLGASSSEVALPSLMEKLECLGCSKSVVGLVVPTGYSFNLDGTTIYLSMAVIFLAQVFQVEFSFSQIMTVIGVLMVTSKGAAGVTGSGFIVLAATLSTLKVIPVEGLALLLGVDRFMSEARALTNFIGNGVATLWLAHHENALDRTKLHQELEI